LHSKGCVCKISTTCNGTAAFTSYGITVVQELTTQIDTDRATGVKLANGPLLEMHEEEFKKKSSCLATKHVFISLDM
jgi:hypothetical protein